MDEIPQTHIGQTVNFKYGEIVYKAVVHNNKITGLKAEHHISEDTSRGTIVKDLITIAGATNAGEDVDISIKSDKNNGPYRILKVIHVKSKSGRI